MWQKLLTILIILIAFTILGVTLFNAYKHRPVEENEPTSEVEVGDVNGLLPIQDIQDKESFQEETISNGSQSSVGEIQTYIKEVFSESANWGLSVAFCESSFNPDVESDNGLYFGLFQFSHSTFNRNCEGSIWEWKDQVICAKKLYEKGEATRKQHWPNCP